MTSKKISELDVVTTASSTDKTIIVTSGQTKAIGLYDLYAASQVVPGPTGPTGPTGPAGADGAAATITVGTVITGAAGTSASVTNSGTSSAAIFDITIPRGDPGTGSGDVSGPASAVNNNVAFFDGTTGKLIKDSGLTLSGTNTGDQDLSVKQDVLVSGTNIKTVNSTSLLGSGDITTGDVTTTGTQTLTNKTIEAGTFTNGYTEESVTANTGAAYTIDLANGSLQILTLTANCTFTFPTATAGKGFTLLLKQDATGSRTVTWDAAVKWPSSTSPTITSTASKADKFTFFADGTNWIGSTAGQNYL